MDKTRYQVEKLNHAQFADEEGSVCPGKILFRWEWPSQNEQEFVENLSELCWQIIPVLGNIKEMEATETLLYPCSTWKYKNIALLVQYRVQH